MLQHQSQPIFSKERPHCSWHLQAVEGQPKGQWAQGSAAGLGLWKEVPEHLQYCISSKEGRKFCNTKNSIKITFIFFFSSFYKLGYFRQRKAIVLTIGQYPGIFPALAYSSFFRSPMELQTGTLQVKLQGKNTDKCKCSEKCKCPGMHHLSGKCPSTAKCQLQYDRSLEKTGCD